MSVRLSQSLSERRRGHDGGVTDAPAYRIWPPIALGVPLLIGVIVTAVAGDPFTVVRDGARVVGAVLFAVFGIWNGWTLTVMAVNRTAVLPGGATRVVLDVALALLWPSAWALIGVPVGMALLSWGAIAPEERYLSTKFGAEYADYRRRVRRWL